MTDSLFDPKDTDQPQIDLEKNYLEDLVGPNKKFKDIEALAKGKWFADQMVDIQNRKMDQLRNDYLTLKANSDARASIEELLDRMEKPEPKSPVQEPQLKTDNAPRITQEDIETIVNRKILETKTTDKAQDNFNTVMSKLKERFGNSYQDVLLEQTENLGLTVDDVNALARKSPVAFFKTMGLDQTPTQINQAPPRSNTAFTPKATPKKTWTYYQAQFKKDPKLYYDPKMTKEMVEAHAELGKEFEDGDFRQYGDTLDRL